MLLNIDLKGTEWVAVNWFSQDPVGCEEIRAGVNVHSVNQEALKLPSRTTAKIFVFRLIYGGTAYSYVYDPDFNWISKRPQYWQEVIDNFYNKYKGIQAQHTRWMNEAISTGRLVMPTGRTYQFFPTQSPSGGLKWPRTKIVNYPVQGLGHDLTTIARVSLFKRIKNSDMASLCEFVSTVHDSIVLDIVDEGLDSFRSIIAGVFDDIPVNFNRLFGCVFNLPVKYELSIGQNLLDMETIV